MGSAVMTESRRQPVFLLAGWGVLPRLLVICGVLLALLFAR